MATTFFCTLKSVTPKFSSASRCAFPRDEPGLRRTKFLEVRLAIFVNRHAGFIALSILLAGARRASIARTGCRRGGRELHCPVGRLWFGGGEDAETAGPTARLPRARNPTKPKQGIAREMHDFGDGGVADLVGAQALDDDIPGQAAPRHAQNRWFVVLRFWTIDRLLTGSSATDPAAAASPRRTSGRPDRAQPPRTPRSGTRRADRPAIQAVG